MIPRNSICPEAVAAKLARADTLEDRLLANAIAQQPRLVELIWFIQWRSCQAGGLEELKSDLLATFPQYFGTEAMRNIGIPASNRYNIAQCLSVWSDFVEPYKGRWQYHVDCKESPISFKSFLAHHCAIMPTAKEAARQAEMLDGVERFNWEFLNAHCRDRAGDGLVEVLVDLCVAKDSMMLEPWYCPDLREMLFAFMDTHALKARARIASTAVVDKVFDALDYAWAEKKLVQVNGSSRFGKTEALTTWANMYPGRVRMVTVPPGNSNQDLVRAVAKAFGFRLWDSTSGPKLQRNVSFVLEHGRVGILADESHYLYPSNVSPNSPPARLNWLRASVVDKGLPCAISTTPQSFDEQSVRFQRITKYNLDQFLGRRSRIVNIPDTLESVDLVAVARMHIPRASEAIIKLIAGAAQMDASYLKAVESIASLARWHARHRPNSEPTKDDFLEAIREAAPRAAEVIDGNAPAPREVPAPKPRRVRQSAAEVIAEIRPGGRKEISQPEPDHRREGNLVSA